MANSWKADKSPRATDEPGDYCVVSRPDGDIDEVPLSFLGAQCPICDRPIAHNSAFRARAGHLVEYWRCDGCGAYRFERR